LSSDFGPNNKRRKEKEERKKQLEEKENKLKITNKKCLWILLVGCGCSENGKEEEKERT
jgi:hypothetical protein